MQLFPWAGRARNSAVTAGLALLALAVLGVARSAASETVSPPGVSEAVSGVRALSGHIPSAVRKSRVVSRLDASRTVCLALSLPLRHQAELDDLLRGLSDPEDARYGAYLTPQQFSDRFSPTPAQYSRVLAYAKSLGLTVVGTHPNRTLVDVIAPVGQIERAFGLHLLVYQSEEDGRYFYAPDSEPHISAPLTSVLSNVVGLDNAAHWHPYFQAKPGPAIAAPLDSYASPLQTGSGPGGGLTPGDIKQAYNLSGVTQNGTGQVLGLFELDGYNPNDIAAYENYYFPSLPAIPLQNVLVDNYSGAAGSGAAEVTLDIELQAALAPHAAKIIVYEGPNSDTGVVDTYNRIAADNLAKQISTSWGEAEYYPSASTRNSENKAFQQMAAQGQTIFAAAGDSGAYDDGTNVGVDDPASQPYMVGVGGTSLSTHGAGGSYQTEATWNRGSASNGAGGGGKSIIWGIPNYQAGVVSVASKGSTTMRNVPDVSLNADPYTGYSVYFGGGWTVYGGTSCAAPLWAAFTALVNQNRVVGGGSPLGFANPPIYALAKGSSYATDFHDIADGSTNLVYPAGSGYDDATGWGSFNGAALLADLSAVTVTATVPAIPINLSAAGGSGQVTLNWAVSSGAVSYNIYRSTSANGEGATPVKTAVTTATYTDTGLTNGTTYYYKVTAVNSVGESGFSNEAVAALKAATTTIANASFETPSVGNASYQYNPAGGAWTFTGNSGLQSNGSAWGAANAPDGTQTAFLQGNPNQGAGMLGSISQSVSFATAGTYLLTFQAAQRWGQVQPLKFSVDGVQVGGLLTPASSNFNPVTVTFSLSSTGTHTLTLSATDGTRDASTFVDQVSLAPSLVPIIANASFETPSVGSATYVYNPAGGAWTFSGNSGLQSNGSIWFAPNAPDGTQTAFLQGNPNQGTLGSLSQSVTFSAAGSYALTFQAARRQGQAQPVQVSVDGVAVGSPLTPAGNSFAPLTSAVFTIGTAGSHTITLTATSNTGDLTTFVDQAAIVQTP